MATLQPGEKSRMYALGGIARGGAFRGGYVSGKVFVAIDGVHRGFGRTSAAAPGIIIDSIQITDLLDETPNRCAFRVNGLQETTGGEVVITLGTKDSLTRWFAGYITETNQVYVGRPANLQTECSAIDYTWLLGFVQVTGRYINQSATAIIQDLIGTYGAANGFTATHVASLPVLNEITFTEEPLGEAITRIMRRIGGYWYVDYHLDVHAFFEETGNGAPAPLTPAHASLDDFVAEMDRSQVLTRVSVEGRGSRLLSHVAIGDTILPLDTVEMFEAAPDVYLKAAFQGSEGGAQYLSFAGRTAGGTGALVGPGIGPSAAPTLAVIDGSGVESGAHSYAVTFVTAAGESLASPIATINTGGVANPTTGPANLRTAPTYSPMYAFNVTIGDTLEFAYAYSTGTPGTDAWGTKVTLNSANSGPIVTVSNQDPLNPTLSAPVYFTIPHSADPRVKEIGVYMHATSRAAQGWRFAFRWPNSAGAGPQEFSTNGGGYPDPSNPTLPAANTTGQNRVAVSAIPIGAATVTARKLYRTAANASQLKLLATIANNTGTTHTDAAPDATLGVNVPLTDTSGLQQPAGQVPAGATTIPVAGTAAFSATGGWAVIGNGEQTVRYLGITGGALTGIPASGPGSIGAAISFNSTVTAAPMLWGIPASGAGSIRTRNLTAGDEIYLVVQVDDAARQAALAADMHRGDGVRATWIQDRRLSVTEARARGSATLALHPLDDRRVTYTCRDLRTSAGKTVAVDLPAPTNVQGTFKIQQVTIGRFRPRGDQYPTFTVDASNRHFSFEDLLRRTKVKD